MLPTAGAQAFGLDDQEALKAYARARAAGSFGAPDEAAKGYAAALAVSPDDDVLAARALNRAVAAGDRELALKAARMLERGTALSSEGRLLLLSEAVRVGDWRGAGLQVDRIEDDEIFAFMAPLLRAWIAVGSGKGDPFAYLETAGAHPIATVYTAEQRPFVLLARGDMKRGIAELNTLAAGSSPRSARLRIAGAATLARTGKRNEALALLTGDSPPIVAARELVRSGRPLRGEIASARAGMAELLLRIAVDLERQNAADIGLSFARLATFLAPENSQAWLAVSQLLAAEEHPKEALEALAQAPADDPYAAAIGDARVGLLVTTGEREAALAQALAAVKGEDARAADWARLGDLHGSLERWDEAAEAYGKAIALSDGQDAGSPAWLLWLLKGGVLDEAGRWPEAKAALQEAYKLAPDQPLVLNYLGYAQLERRENLVEAEKLVAEASRLQPDSAEITDSLGWAHFLRGDLPKAIELLERAARGQPADPEINEHLGDAYYKVGRRYEARYAWKAALLYAEGEDAARIRAKIESGLTEALASP